MSSQNHADDTALRFNINRMGDQKSPPCPTCGRDDGFWHSYGALGCDRRSHRSPFRYCWDVHPGDVLTCFPGCKTKHDPANLPGVELVKADAPLGTMERELRDIDLIEGTWDSCREAAAYGDKSAEAKWTAAKMNFDLQRQAIRTRYGKPT